MALMAQAGVPAGSMADTDPLTLEDGPAVDWPDVLRCFAVELTRFWPLRLRALFCVRMVPMPSMSTSGTAIEPGGGSRGVATAACGICEFWGMALGATEVAAGFVKGISAEGSALSSAEAAERGAPAALTSAEDDTASLKGVTVGRCPVELGGVG